MIVISSATNVLVFKAVGLLPLRIFPGHNDIGDIDIKKYTDGNPAALAALKENIVPAEGAISGDNQALAKAAKEKNDMLNKSAKILKATEKKLDMSEANLQNANDMILELRKRMAELEAKNAEREVEVEEVDLKKGPKKGKGK